MDPAGPGEVRDRLGALAPALREIGRRYGTPVYVTDVASVEDAAARVTAAFPSPWERRYSLKANNLPALVARLSGLGFGANVVSRGEWELATRAGVPNADITLEGIGKSDADLRAAVKAAARGVPLHWIALESADEAAALARAVRDADGRMTAAPRAAGAARAGSVAAGHGTGGDTARLRVDVLLRLNPEVEPETHHGLATGAAASKFGLTADEMAAAIAAGGGPDGPLRFRGLHLHVGSQLGAADAWRDAVRRALALLALLRGGLPTFDTLDVGADSPSARWAFRCRNRAASRASSRGFWRPSRSTGGRTASRSTRPRARRAGRLDRGPRPPRPGTDRATRGIRPARSIRVALALPWSRGKRGRTTGWSAWSSSTRA